MASLKGLADLLMFRPPAPEPLPATPEKKEDQPAAPPVPAPPPAPKAVKKAIPAAIAAMIAATMAVEGGYVNDPADPGGETNMGITKKVAVQNGYTGPMRTLPKDIAVSIYYKDYIVAPGFEPLVEINAPVVAELYDTGTNMGPKWPSLWLQQGINDMCSLSLAIDGRVGPGTVAAFASCQNRLGAAQMCVAMLDYLDAKQKTRYYAIVKAKPSSSKFLRGWLNNRIGNVDRRECRVGGPE
jgi:lysozyme family protein